MKAPWIEKYRPTKLEDVVADPKMVEKFQSFLENPKDTFPHLLFAGTPGLGKTTCAKILANSITEDIYYVNASEERGIDKSREIADFCGRMTFDESQLKIVILDEFDNMTNDAQLSLKNTMEENAEWARFILTCNHISKVDRAIESRCQTYNFTDTPKSEIAKRCVRILEMEGVKPVNPTRDLKLIINQYYPDIRSVVGALQRFSNQGIFKVDTEQLGNGHEDQLVEWIKAGEWQQIQSKLCGAVPFDSLFNAIFKRAEDISKEYCVDIMMAVGEAKRFDASVADRQMNFMYAVLQVMRIIEVV
jgi:replication factor C small subunit